MRIMLKSKIQRATVTGTNLDYDGSITIDKDLMKAVDILPYEKVEVMNVNTGARFETYAIEGDRGEIILNGACARLAYKEDIVIILAYKIVDTIKLDPPIFSSDPQDKEWNTLSFRFWQIPHQPHIVQVDKDNTIRAVVL